MKMKLINKISIFALALVFSSCLQDLNTVPLKETDMLAGDAYKTAESYTNALAYINGYYMLVGQSDAGKNDLGYSDSGQSEFIRQWFNLNEMTADGLKSVWSDAYISELCSNTWSTTNLALDCVYTRALKGITLVNEYLLNTTDEVLESRGQSDLKTMVRGYRAEARFHRAMFFYVLMDIVGNPPFPMPEDIGGLPKQIKRADLFNWLETELLALAAEDSDMPDYGEVPYPRPTKGAVWALLSRMYLNAEVYTGTPRWADAKTASKNVIEMGYKIHPEFTSLFRQDNTTNGATEEFIFAIAYDRNTTQSWGGTTTFTSASVSEAANVAIGKYFGLEKINAENWGGYHVPNEYVANFELVGVKWGTDDAFGFDRENSDKRALLSNHGCSRIFDPANLSTGWFCWKYCGLDSEDKFDQAQEAGNDNFKLSSADMPLFRLAEMYLNYAEADARLNDGVVADALAKDYIEELRDRAGVTTPATIDLEWLLKERARELMWEGHRRVDLIRFGKYTQASHPWPQKNGILSGNSALPSYRTIFPLIQSDFSAHGSLVQNPNY